MKIRFALLTTLAFKIALVNVDLPAEIRTYDAAGRLIWTTQNIGASTKYTYDKNNNILSVTNVVAGTDTDGDGLPDYWELHYSGSITGLNWDDDLDGDGLSNLEEFGLFRNPFHPDSSGSSGWGFYSPTPQEHYQILQYRRPQHGPLTVQYIGQVSYDLIDWTSDTLEIEELSVVAVGGGMEEVTLRAKVMLGTGEDDTTQIFIRLTITPVE